MLFQDGKFQWGRAEKLLGLAKEGSGALDITSTVKDALRVVLLDDKLRMQLVNAFTEDNRLHIGVSPLPEGLCLPHSRLLASACLGLQLSAGDYPPRICHMCSGSNCHSCVSDVLMHC